MDKLLDKYMKIYDNEIKEEKTLDDNNLIEYDFKMPIEYNNFNKLNETIKDDIEFNGDKNIMNLLLKTNNNDNKDNLLLNKWSTLYSTDKQYIKDNQSLIENYNLNKNNMDDFIDEYMKFKSEQNFLSKYQYIQFKRFFYLNSIVGILQILAIYNICSPIISLIAPILGLIIPYFVLYFKGIKLNFKDYLSLVKKIIINNYIIKGVLNFKNNSLQKNMYTLVSIFFYFLSIYNNIIYCIQYYNNTNFIINFLNKYNNFIEEGELLIDNTLKQTKNLNKFKYFNSTLNDYKKNIQKMKNNLSLIKNDEKYYIKYSKVGVLLKYNFDIFYNDEFHDTILYLIYLNNYNKDLSHFSALVKDGKINKCKILNNKSEKKSKIKNMYYLPHINENNIKNNISLKDNIIITGPNAAGKTTLIKSTIINLFLSQNIGFGCYSNCSINIYDHFHCYLNIPDTSNRDSLFQAEARRCKEIFEFIKNNKNKKHFCIFDEIYSGTNPSDAVLCATLYLKELNKYKKNVDYLITTHYIKICENFDNEKYVINKRMKTKQTNNKLKYYYKLENGISRINGGLHILENMKNT